MDRTPFDIADAAYQTAKEQQRLHPSPEAMRTVIDAWNAREAVAPKRKVSGYESRAGRRQYAERLALSKRR